MNKANRARFIATLKHIWSLHGTETVRLSRYYMKEYTVSELLSKLNVSHEYKDYIQGDEIKYEVSYLECGYEYLTKLPIETKILVSFRYSLTDKIAIVIVRQAVHISSDGIKTSFSFSQKEVTE